MELINRIKFFLLNPYIISIIIAFFVITLTPDLLKEYEINFISKEKLASSKKVIFEDIDNDKKSEKITFLSKQASRASYILQDKNGAIIDQYNLSSEFAKHSNYWFQDINKNGFKELYLITKSNDSIFLNIHEHFVDKGIWKEKIFVDKIGVYKGFYKFSASQGENKLKKILKINEIVFSISAGFGLKPRNIYKYNYTTGKVEKSNHLINTIYFNDVIDLKNGNYKLLSKSVATANELDKIQIKKSDKTSWLFILDSNLKFTFSPIDLKSKGRLKPIYLEDKSGIYPIFLFQSLDKKMSSKLIKIDFKGNILKEYSFLDDKNSTIIKLNKNSFAIYNNVSGIVNFFDINFKIIKSKKIEQDLGYIHYIDINNDGTKEWVSFKNINKDIVFYSSNFKTKTKKRIYGNYLRDYGVKYSNSGKKYFFIVHDSDLSYFEYNKNKFYNLRYIIYLTIYLIILLVVFIIIKGQQYRDKKKKELEKNILDLQLKNIKNQVDSHFVFNAINTISEMSLSDNKLELDKFIGSYSKFMRSTLENSDKIATTIKEELDYVENFLQLQQIKLNHKFDYYIYIDNDVNQQIKFPKHSLFTCVENAIKYGLPKGKKGLINITFKKEKGKLFINVYDNGEGLKSKIDYNKGTGNGLEIMKKIFKLFKERFKTDIDHSLQNIIENKKVVGTNAKIEIKLSKKYT
ncbi:sensor histidine kinase [Polaribacter porphyrae]|uniref:Signal transduction histidine kinase internal region domain-containing protein n=1 Tax=Polaribacter porphyrae TaxID=1137780 RepID=A0A2S7WPM9_9FLAO|nr:histidine kinase [Polaribacter porphyrae]PQJ79565.1 hypothetical protein BTO18_10455 [Polaribacter porphyrae]